MNINDIASRLVEAAAAHRRQEASTLGKCLADQLRSGGSVAADLGVEAVAALRNVRAFDELTEVARALVGQASASRTVHRLLGQALIERGETEEALATLESVRSLEPAHSGEWAEATGLIGRIFKDRLLGCSDLLSPKAKELLAKAIAYYQEAYSSNPNYVWQGLNVLGLRFLAQRIAPDLGRGGPDATTLIATLERTPPEDRNRWFHASMAEANIPLGNWERIERSIGFYARDPATSAFQLGGTLRQLTRLWRLPELGERGRSLVNLLHAALLKKEEGCIRLEPGQEIGYLDAIPSDEQLEAVLGEEGPVTYAWWKAGVETALSVALVRKGLAKGVGTGFVVRGGDLAPRLGDELLVLTNAHVVSENPIDGGLLPGVAKIAFHDAMSDVLHDVEKIVWSSPKDGGLDASLLRLSPPPPSGRIKPLSFARTLPVLDEKQRVYVIGHPNGGELAVSLHDNELLDHEGPPLGTPPTPACRRVHYRTPTEHGNSGSPVFDSYSWAVIALHHKGGSNMPKLNGQAGLYKANEGIWIQSIIEAAREELARGTE